MTFNIINIKSRDRTHNQHHTLNEVDCTFSVQTIQWYASTLGVTAGAVLFATMGLASAILVLLVTTFASYFYLSKIRLIHEHNTLYNKISEQLAVASLLIFMASIVFFNILIALLIFLYCAQWALIFQTYDYRRFYIGMAVSFAGICVGAAESKTGTYLLFFIIYATTACITLGYAYLDQQQSTNDLSWSKSDRLRISGILFMTTAVIYLLIPRFPAGSLMARPASQHFYENRVWEAEAQKNETQNVQDQLDELIKEKHQQTKNKEDLNSRGNSRHWRKSGFSYRGFEQSFDINNPDDKGDRFSNRIIARVRADSPNYLRAQIFDLFDGIRWHSSSDKLAKLLPNKRNFKLSSTHQQNFSNISRYEVIIEEQLGDYIPAAAVPITLEFPSSSIGIDLFGQLRSPDPLKPGTSYAVESEYSVQDGRLFAELDYQALDSYTQLPEKLDQRIINLTNSITQNAYNELETALALEKYLRNQYQYDLDSVFNSQNKTPLATFLFEKKSGHCEYFASALAIMLRTQNIPSRLVTGFSATNRNPLTGYYDVYALDGHAWVEAYVDKRGWVILEPTAYYNGPLPKDEKLSAKQINQYVERLLRQEKALNQGEFSFSTLTYSIWKSFYLVITIILSYMKLFLLTAWPYIGCTALLFAISWFIWYHYQLYWLAYCIKRKVEKYTPKGPKEDIEFYLRAIMDLLRLVGIPHHPGDTIEQYLTRIQKLQTQYDINALAFDFNCIHYNSGDDKNANKLAEKFESLYQEVINYLISNKTFYSTLKNNQAEP